MESDRNLLFGVLALQSGLILPGQFIECCTAWTARRCGALADLLIERGWIRPDDRVHLDYLVERNLQQYGGDVRASLAGLPEPVKRSLATIEDGSIRRSVGHLNEPACDPFATTLGYTPECRERYTLIRLHAIGGIGRIWHARDNHLGRDIALKELRPEQASIGDLRARFQLEARITGQLEHPGIVPIHEFARWPNNGQPFYTMRLVRGRTLSEAARGFHDRRESGRYDSLEFVTMLNAFVMVCNTLAFAHSRGVLHRDLKGQNVVLGDFGEVALLDWGLAKRLDCCDDHVGGAMASESGSHDESALTVYGQALGTPAYMSPEQATGSIDEIDHRTDVYGLGAILYEILTGEPPFLGDDSRQVLRRVIETPPAPPRTLWPDVPPALEAACLRALAKDPADRFATPSQFAQEVQQWQEVERRQAEEALRASEALYHSLVETIPMNVWRKDAEGRFTFGNRGFCETTKRSLPELIGRTDFDLFPAELAEKYRQDDAWVLSTGRTLEVVEEHRTAEGESLLVHVVKLPIRDGQGKIVGTQGIFWDVSDRKRIDEAMARLPAARRPETAGEIEAAPSVD